MTDEFPRMAEGRRLEWFDVSGPEQFLVGVPLDITGPGPGYEKALAFASDVVAQPHRQASRDMLFAECKEFAELLVNLADEDGHALSVAAVLRAMLIEAARRVAEQTGGNCG